MTERLQKALARAGLASRREIEKWIEQGRISVNGKTAILGMSVTAQDKVSVDGRLVNVPEQEQARARVLIYNKPEGELCTRKDEKGRPTIFESLPSIRQGRWINIGRLDTNTMGLLLVTNDGELAHRLMHPSYQIEREYAVRVFGEVTQQQINTLLKGVKLEDGMARFDKIVDAGGEGMNHWYHVILKEGRNREVRRLWESQGLRVSRLMRVRFGHLTLPRGLKRGHWGELDVEAIEKLYHSVKLKPSLTPNKPATKSRSKPSLTSNKPATKSRFKPTLTTNKPATKSKFKAKQKPKDTKRRK